TGPPDGRGILPVQRRRWFPLHGPGELRDPHPFPRVVGDAPDFIVEGSIIQLHKYNGNPIGLQLPAHVELNVTYTEPGARGDTGSSNVTKPAQLETGIEIRVPLFIKEGEIVKVSTETREFAGRA